MRVAFFIVFVRKACFLSFASRDCRRLLEFGPSFFGGTWEPLKDDNNEGRRYEPLPVIRVLSPKSMPCRVMMFVV